MSPLQQYQDSQSPVNSSDEQSAPLGQSDKTQIGKSIPRKFAEWVSLTISVLLIVVLAGYLLYEALQSNDSFIPVEVRILKSQADKAGDRYVLPIEVTNRGGQTLRDLQVEVTAQPSGKSSHSADQQPQKREITIDYLGEQSKTQVYIYFEQNPKQLRLKAEALYYRLD